MLSFYKNEDIKFEKTHNIDQDCWINIEHATTEDLEKLCQLIHTSITDLVDALDHHELPRMEKTGNFLLLFVRHPIEKTGHLHTISVTILLKDSYFITICPAKSPLIEEFLQRQAPPSSPSLLLIQFLQRISQEFSGQIKKARHSVMDQGKEMHAVDSEDIFSLTEHEEVLNQYLSSLGPLQSAMKDLLEVDWPLLHTNYRQEIDDLVNAIKQ